MPFYAREGKEVFWVEPDRRNAGPYIKSEGVAETLLEFAALAVESMSRKGLLPKNAEADAYLVRRISNERLEEEEVLAWHESKKEKASEVRAYAKALKADKQTEKE